MCVCVCVCVCVYVHAEQVNKLSGVNHWQVFFLHIFTYQLKLEMIASHVN